MVSQEGIKVDLTKVETILKWESKNVSKICSFLGLAGYYRSFVENFFKIVAPFIRLTRKDVRFNYDDNCELAFVVLK